MENTTYEKGYTSTLMKLGLSLDLIRGAYDKARSNSLRTLLGHKLRFSNPSQVAWNVSRSSGGNGILSGIESALKERAPRATALLERAKQIPGFASRDPLLKSFVSNPRGSTTPFLS